MNVLLSIMKYNVKQTFERKAFRYAIFVQPFLFSILFFYMNKSGGNRVEPMSIIMKSGSLSLWSSVCFSSLSDLQVERDTRTLGALLGTPTSLVTIITGKVIPNTILGLISFIVSSITICTLSGFQSIRFSFLGSIFSLVTLLTSYIVVALCIIPLLALNDNGKLFVNYIEYPVYILTGMAFPVTILPHFFKCIGNLIPITWAIRISDNFATNGFNVEGITNLLYYAGTMTIYILFAYILFKKMEKY